MKKRKNHVKREAEIGGVRPPACESKIPQDLWEEI